MKTNNFFERFAVRAFSGILTGVLSISAVAEASWFNSGSDNCEQPQETNCATYEDWYFHADFLWWKASEDGLALGKEVLIARENLNGMTGNYENVSDQTKVKQPNFDYDAGCKVGIMYANPDYGWDALFDWTHFETEAKARGFSDLDTTADPHSDFYIAFVPAWEALAQNFPEATHGKWKLDMNLYDVEIGKKFCISPCFAFRPFFGFRVAQIDQEYKVHSFNNVDGDFNGASYTYKSEMKAHCNFIGVGPRLGFDAEFDMFCGLSLFGQAAGSLVYGKFNRHAHERFHNLDDYYFDFDNFEYHAHGNGNDYCSRAISDLSIGIKWKHLLEVCSWSFPIMIAASWEHHGFFDFNRFNFERGNFTNTNSDDFDFGPYANLLNGSKKEGDLFTQGLTLAFILGF